MKYTSSYNISVDFTPWCDNGFIIKSLHINEELGGKIADGVIEMELVGTEESLKLVTKQYTGKLIIEKEGGNIYNIDIFVVKREYYKNTLKLDFLCISDKKFYTELVSLEYPDLVSAINSLYPGKVDIRCLSDINNQPRLIQNMETNHSYCTKLAYSFKKDSIFAFGWDGFLLKERIGKFDSRGNLEPKLALIGGLGAESMDPNTMRYDSMLFEKPWDPWLSVSENEETNKYSELVPQNSRTVKIFNKYITVGTDYSGIIENYIYNTEQMKSGMSNTLRIKLNDIPDYRLGDVIKYKHIKDKEIPFSVYLVKANEFFYSIDGKTKDTEGSNIFWVSKIVALDWEGQILPQEDILTDMGQDGSIK